MKKWDTVFKEFPQLGEAPSITVEDSDNNHNDKNEGDSKKR